MGGWEIKARRGKGEESSQKRGRGVKGGKRGGGEKKGVREGEKIQVRKMCWMVKKKEKKGSKKEAE